jgi:glutaredoxin 3
MSASVEVPRPRAKVVMYRTRYCPYCVSAARLFQRKGVEVTEIDVSGDTECRRWLIETTGMRTVPQIFINGRSVHGFQDVAALDRRGLLDQLLQEPPSNNSPDPFDGPCDPANQTHD